ncbi:Maf family nucleotide pyrophosphatase [Patulibacter americanus]|uniref:Maf family nucleotide pyrophosphatase n=1 Tax=Patulibacter americanus TaxID=588672 RepID=UPI0003B452AA|nr:Maf family protein [Patulibacter americanus]
MPAPAGPALVLASASPQRRTILTTLRVPHRVRVAGVEETADGEPVAVAVENALRKARAVAALEPAGTLVLGADTVIVDRTEPMPRAVGKPGDAAEAAAMLARWSGADHHVASAAAVVRAGAGEGHEVLLADADLTRVRFRLFDEADVAWYVGTGEWEGRAGAYAIQERGGLLVDGIDGDWWTVVGLPVAMLARRMPQLLR